MFAFLFSKTTCLRCVELIVALPYCVRKVTPHCIPATQHDEGNQKWGAHIYGTFNRCNCKCGHCVFLKDCWESKLCFWCLPESHIMSLSSLINRYSYRESGYGLCIVDDFMNLFFFNQILIVLEILVYQVALVGKGEVFLFLWRAIKTSHLRVRWHIISFCNCRWRYHWTFVLVWLPAGLSNFQ